MTFLVFNGLSQSGSSHQILLCLYIHVPYIYTVMCILSLEQRLQPLLQLDASFLLRVLVTKNTLWMLEFLYLKNNDLAALSEYWVSHLILISFQYLFLFLCTGLECVGQSVGSLLTSVLEGHIMRLALNLDENGMGLQCTLHCAWCHPSEVGTFTSVDILILRMPHSFKAYY